MAVKRKKLWIVLTVVCCVILTLGLVFGLAFRLKTVDVEFIRRNDPSNLEANIADKIKEDGEFEFGKNIIFLNFDESIAKIEKANPYVKVNQVIKAFPNIVRVYIVERVPQFRVQDKTNANKWYILDNEYKVLEIIETEDISTNKFYELTLEISPNTLTLGGGEQQVGRGDFVTFSNDYDNYCVEIADGLYGATKSYVSAYGIEITKDGNKLIFTVTMLNEVNGKGCKIQIDGKDDLYDKVVRGVKAFEYARQNGTQTNLNNKTIYVSKDSNGDINAVFSSDD